MEWMPQRYREHREICPQKGQIYHRYQSGFPWCHAGIRQKSHSWIKSCENREVFPDSEYTLHYSVIIGNVYGVCLSLIHICFGRRQRLFVYDIFKIADSSSWTCCRYSGFISEIRLASARASASGSSVPKIIRSALTPSKRQRRCKEMCIRDRFKEMYRWIDNSVHLNVNDMFDAALRNTRIEMSPAERRQFYEKHIRHMTLTIDENGNVSIELKRG